MGVNNMSEGEQTGLVPKYKTWLKRISTKIGLQVLYYLQAISGILNHAQHMFHFQDDRANDTWTAVC
jgi:hypothetical protein